MIDLSDVLNDPELGAQTLSRVRVDLTADAKGRAVSVETASSFTGIVTQDKGAILERTENAAYVAGSILITTATPLCVADVVVWKGQRYNVNTVTDYQAHGVTWAVCNPDGIQ